MPNHSMSGTGRKPASLTRKSTQPKSDVIFRPHKPASADERKMHGLVDVYDRETGEHLGMLNPIAGGGYVMRDRTGERLGASNHGYIEDVTYLSRDAAARILRQRIAQHDRMLARRVGTVSEGCPNKWHNSGSAYKATTACPECPTQAGLKYAVRLLDGLDYGDLTVVIDRLRSEIYAPADDANYIPSEDVLNAGK